MALGDKKERLLMDLGKPEWNVMFWLLKVCFPDGRVLLDMDMWTEGKRGSKTILFRGLNKLMERGLVVRLKRGYYLVNPYFFFAGHPIYLDRALTRFDRAVEGKIDLEDPEDSFLEGNEEVQDEPDGGPVLPGPGRFAV